MRFLRSLLTLLRAPVAIASITPVALGPDDVIVLHVREKRLSPEQVTLIREQLKAVWPRQRSLLLDAGMSLEVLTVPPGMPVDEAQASTPARLRAVEPDRSVVAPPFGRIQESFEGRAPKGAA